MQALRRIARGLDPGWLFVVAGLAMGAAITLIPAQNDLEELRRQLRGLQQEEAFIAARLRAHANFLDALERGEPTLVKRLIAAQLNLMPEGEQPVLLVKSSPSSVIEWIDDTVREERTSPLPTLPSRLSTLADGRYRLWLLGGSVLCIYAGLIAGIPSPVAERRKVGRRRFSEHGHSAPCPPDEHAAEPSDETAPHDLTNAADVTAGITTNAAADHADDGPVPTGLAADTVDREPETEHAIGAADESKHEDVVEEEQEAADISDDDVRVAEAEDEPEATDEHEHEHEPADEPVDEHLGEDEEPAEVEEVEDEYDAGDEDDPDLVGEDEEDPEVEDEHDTDSEDDEVDLEDDAPEDDPDLVDEDEVDHEIEDEHDAQADEDTEADEADDEDADEDEDEDADEEDDGEYEYEYVYVDEDGNPIADDELDEYEFDDEPE